MACCGKSNKSSDHEIMNTDFVPIILNLELVYPSRNPDDAKDWDKVYDQDKTIRIIDNRGPCIEKSISEMSKKRMGIKEQLKEK
mmetsp:Transcript_16855/g.16518  ORF Transcript_16855/g.16518 Transcript_16855/m.16518 type:complete len:84 (+) Transcript_16855:7-258(+)